MLVNVIVNVSVHAKAQTFQLKTNCHLPTSGRNDM